MCPTNLANPICGGQKADSARLLCSRPPSRFSLLDFAVYSPTPAVSRLCLCKGAGPAGCERAAASLLRAYRPLRLASSRRSAVTVARSWKNKDPTRHGTGEGERRGRVWATEREERSRASDGDHAAPKRRTHHRSCTSESKRTIWRNRLTMLRRGEEGSGLRRLDLGRVDILEVEGHAGDHPVVDVQLGEE